MGHSDMQLFTNTWNLKILAFLHVFGVLVFISWLLPDGLLAWRSIDIPAFYLLNGSLDGSADGWTQFWGLANLRQADLVALAIILIGFLAPGICFNPLQLRRALLGFIFFLLVLLVVREFLDALVGGLGIVTPSPTLVLNEARLLSDIFPGWGAKDRSGASFPGDHATVLLLWAVYVLMYGRIWGGILTSLIAIMLMLPRLIGGAHWLSDNIVGGVFCVSLTIAWAVYTPLAYRFTTFAQPYFDTLVFYVGRLPILNKMVFFRPTGM